MVDYEKALKDLITGSINVANATHNGFVVTDDTICALNTMIIINHMKNIVCNCINDEQAENIYETYNYCMNKQMFHEWNKESYINNIINSYKCCRT